LLHRQIGRLDAREETVDCPGRPATPAAALIAVDVLCARTMLIHLQLNTVRVKPPIGHTAAAFKSTFGRLDGPLS
jgi:hypothetical protein